MRSYRSRTRLLLALTLMSALALAAPGAGQEQRGGSAGASLPPDRPPKLLRGGGFLVPPELLGEETSPEVSVRVEIDARGHPSAVEVLSVQPTTEHQAEIADAVRQTLLDWRYAPRRVESRAVPATLSWRIRFQGSDGEVEASVAGPVPTTTAGGELAGADQAREDYARRILELPEQRRIKLLDELARRAIGWLDEETAQRVATPHFIVYADGRRKGVAEAIAGNLEAVLDTLTSFFGTDVPLYPEKYKLVAVVYGREDQSAQLRSSVFNYDWAAGFYHPAGLISFHREVHTPGRLLSLLIHEVTHAFLDRHVVRPGTRIPTWLNEGFADYIGSSRVRKGKLQLGTIASRELFVTMYGVVNAQTGETLNLELLQRALRRGEAPPVERILNAESTGFYGGDVEDVRLHYAFAWLLVHYLRHGDPAWGEGPFTDLLLYASEGYPVAPLLRQRFDLAGERLEKGFREYVDDL